MRVRIGIFKLNQLSPVVLPVVMLLVSLCMWSPPGESREVLSNPLSPEVAMTVTSKGSSYHYKFDVENPYAKVSGKLVIGNKTLKQYTFSKFPANVLVPKSEVVKGQILLGLEVSWFNQDGSLRQREVFNSPQIAGELKKSSTHLTSFPLEDYFERLKNEKLRILIPVDLKKPSKVTIAINDKTGRRVRNLISGIQYPAGKQSIEWDGRTDYGTIVAPGSYDYRLLTHPGIEHDLKMQFSNGGEPIDKMLGIFGPNHSMIHNFYSNKKYLFAASPNTEGGHAIISMDFAGNYVKGYHKHLGTGMSRSYPAADDKRLYVLHDGVAWGGSRAKTFITISCYDIETGNVIQLKSAIKRSGRNIRFNTIVDSSMPLGKDGKAVHYALQGAAILDKILYFSHYGKNQIMMYDTTSDTLKGGISVQKPGRLSVWNGKLYATSGTKVVEVNTKSKTAKTIFNAGFKARGMAVDDTSIYLSGHKDNTIKIFTLAGKSKATLGKPGGYYTGKWQPERLVNPFGLIIAHDRSKSLWIAEERWNPKRMTCWNTRLRKLMYEKNGPPTYGSPSAGFDTKDGSRWIADGCLWNVNTTSKKANVVSVIHGEKGRMGTHGKARNYRFVYHGKRTFVIGQGQVTTISELLPNNTLKELAAISSPNIFSFATGRKDLPAFNDALQKAFPKDKLKKSIYDQSTLLMWVDKDGDSTFDADEFQFTPRGISATTGYWGFAPHTLSFQLCIRDSKGKVSIVSFNGESFNACGAPDYNIAKALAAAKPLQDALIPGVQMPPNGQTYTDNHGNVILNESPFMYSFSKTGKLNWFFPNGWSGVHASQKAPLPIPGQIQGQLFSIGLAPLDRYRDVMALMNNHGRVFFMTTDGMYLDEMFSDVRVSYTLDDNYIGGEHFGGFFEYDQSKKRFMLQAGNSGYRVYEINGLDKIKESKGSLSLTPEQLEAAAKLNPIGGEGEGDKEITIAYKSGFDINKINSEKETANWKGPQDIIGLRTAYDSKYLYLSYKVWDPSPWVNNGKDVTTLFKTGDCVDIQLATDLSSSAQDEKRRKGAEGDIRLLIAPFNGKSVAVRYRHVVKKGAGLSPMQFNSPWRSHKVDDVKVMDTVKIDVSKGGREYTAKVAIPLSDLGLSVDKLKGKTVRGDFGVIFGDSAGTVNLARLYWANKATGLVNDVPGEILPEPHLWGTLTFGN